MAGSREPAARQDLTALSEQRAREDALRAIHLAFAGLEPQRHTDDRLSDLADAIDAFSEGAWAVAVALAEASTTRRSQIIGAARPGELSRSWEEMKRDFEAAIHPRVQLIPIVDADRHVLGWTPAVPEIVGDGLRHAEAERILRCRIISRRVELVRPRDIAKAGGPTDWRGPWICNAICSVDIAKTLRPIDVPTAQSRGEKITPLLGRTRRWISRWTGPPRSSSGQ